MTATLCPSSPSRRPEASLGDATDPFPALFDDPPPKEYRIRFYNYNMANSSHFQSLSSLQAPGGRGAFLDAFEAPMADGRPPDAMFATLVETRLDLSEWVDDYLSKNRDSRLDSVLSQNAREEGRHHTQSRVRSFMEGLAAIYNGNLMSMLSFSSKEFTPDRDGDVFGRLTEASIGGMPVPNPKKAFMGRSLVSETTGLRLCFLGAHFPMAKLASALDAGSEQLETAKTVFAQTLRRVLRKASKRALTDERSLIFLQGDINSRTVLSGGKVNDVLLEFLEDDELQESIQQELAMEPGRWRELVPIENVYDLPVTYKFKADVQCRKKSLHGSPGRNALTIGDVMKSGSRIFQSESPYRSEMTDSGLSLRQEPDNVYKRTLDNIGAERLSSWGVAFKKHDFKSYRFPACADRIIYWCSDALAEQLELEILRGGYEVNHGQLGSDHRPVSLELILRIKSSIPFSLRKMLPPSIQAGNSFMIVSANASDESCVDGDLDDFLQDEEIISPNSCHATRTPVFFPRIEDVDFFNLKAYQDNNVIEHL